MNQLTSVSVAYQVSEKLKAYGELLKVRLSFLVAFSSGFGYLLASRGATDWGTLLLLSLGGFLVSGASVAVNQVIEKDLDKLMTRTMNRPLPTHRLSVREALIFASATALAGLGLIAVFVNPLTAVLSAVSMVLYTLVYTPVKRVGPIAVFVGAIPGALPPLLGWVAATGSVSHEAMIIFGIQFIWQFPHFWAIAWVADEDYRKAGFRLLPFGGQKDFRTAVNIMIYTLFLLPLGLLPAYFGITGINSAVMATVCGVLFLSQTFILIRDCTREAALRLMFGSFIYLPVVQIAYLLDKI